MENPENGSKIEIVCIDMQCGKELEVGNYVEQHFQLPTIEGKVNDHAVLLDENNGKAYRIVNGIYEEVDFENIKKLGKNIPEKKKFTIKNKEDAKRIFEEQHKKNNGLSR